jgi:hypothetical protein
LQARPALNEQYVIVLPNAQQSPDPLNRSIDHCFKSLGPMAHFEYRHARALKIEHFHLRALEHNQGQSSRSRIKVENSLTHFLPFSFSAETAALAAQQPGLLPVRRSLQFEVKPDLQEPKASLPHFFCQFLLSHSFFELYSCEGTEKFDSEQPERGNVRLHVEISRMPHGAPVENIGWTTSGRGFLLML